MRRVKVSSVSLPLGIRSPSGGASPGLRRAFPGKLGCVVFLGVFFLGLGPIPGVASQDRPDALVLYRQGQYQRAVEITLQELEENAANLDAYTVLGWSLLALNRYDEALQYGERGLRVSRFDNRIIHIVGDAHFRKGNHSAALQHLQNYVALAPEGRQLPHVYYMMGEIFLNFGEYNHADIALTQAVLLAADRAPWWARLGYAREQAGSKEGALQAYQAALERAPALPEALQGVERLQG
ncbi:Tetratricopeptide repeat-containing protein [Alkalispirochaeta americana]|uniref:Tetratricopeptide repeat-containing protein n=1 Tax=Alkalispirochaeta americana TaxID=159291 RepID=A0A1N6WRK1_9SPIO|nr:tetratricopeptide repeat protein [Alkalispirochaeta americana]SIQ92662.1 Tetratricopeptide repeat-containing protein [Alkalispirochaeta americana]